MKSLQDLEAIRERARQAVRQREAGSRARIVVGMGTCGIAAGARETMTAILDELNRRGISDVAVTQTGCIGLCEQEPLVTVEVPGRPRTTYGHVDADRARRIVSQHVVNDQMVSEWVIATT